MATKRNILEVITREALLAVAKEFEITGLTGKNRDEIVDALVAVRRVTAEAVLGTFDRDELKTICRSLEMDDTGREKQVLIDRLLGRAESEETTATAATKGLPMARNKITSGGDGLEKVEDYRYKGVKRKNNPPAKIAAEGSVPVMPKIEYLYSPRRPPTLRFDATGGADKLLDLLAEAGRRKLTPEELRTLAEALRTQEPWLDLEQARVARHLASAG